MNRSRKTKTEITTPSVENKNEILSPEQVFSVLEFARSAYSGSFGFPGVYTPELVNARMRDISLNPAVATKEKIEKALNNPKESEEELVGYSEFFELQNMLYKRVLRYLSNMLSWNMSYVCTNVENESDYNSKEYKKDINKVKNFFDKMNIKQEFGTALREMIRREVFFTYFRDDGSNYVFQELPREFCKITARSEWGGLIFDFSTLWFLRAGTDLNMYPPIFKKFYQETLLNKGNSNNFYDPATPLNARDSHWVYWHQTSPELGFWCFKFSPEMVSEIPLLAPLFPDLMNQAVIRQLQTNSYMAQASKILTSQIPYMNKESKGAANKDNIAITPKLLGEFLNILRQALSSAISVAAMPTEEIQGIEFTGSNDIYDSYLKSTASLSGINSRLIYTAERQNVLETRLSTNVDMYFVTPVYAQFEAFLNYQVNKLTKKYKFKFSLSGVEFKNEKEKELETANTLAANGIVLPQKFANALDMNIFDLERMLAEGRASGFVDKLTPIISSFQQSGGGKLGGRPSKSESDLGDSGSDTRGSGANEEKESDE